MKIDKKRGGGGEKETERQRDRQRHRETERWLVLGFGFLGVWVTLLNAHTIAAGFRWYSASTYCWRER